MKLSEISTEELKTAAQEMRKNMLAPVERTFFQYESLANSAPDASSVEVYSLLEVETELATRLQGS